MTQSYGGAKVLTLLIKMLLKVGQVLNSKGWGIYGKLIRWRNKRKWGEEGWGHTSIIVEVQKNHVVIAEALYNGFKLVKYEKYWLKQKIKEKFYVVGESRIYLRDVYATAEKYEGRGYGWFDILFILFGSRKGKTGANKLICSEAIARILYDCTKKRVDLEKEFGIDYDLIEPMHLWKSKQMRWFK